MKFDSKVNYTILATDVTPEFLKRYFDEFIIIDADLTYNKLKEKLEFFPSKQVVFNESWYNLSDLEKNAIINLLNIQNIRFINITSNIDDALLSDYIIVFDKNEKVLEGDTKSVLAEEKILTKLGFGLPFVVELSKRLEFYDLLDKTYYDINSLVEDLWT